MVDGIRYPDLAGAHNPYAPKPSAPSMEEVHNAQIRYPDLHAYSTSVRPAQPNLPKPAQEPLFPDCTICLENCIEHPDGDKTKPKLIAKTGCNHFFHDFCMQQWMSEGANKNCPNCRAPLNTRSFQQIKIDAQGKPQVLPQQKMPEDAQPNEEGYDIQLSAIGEKLAQAALATSRVVLSLMGASLWYAAKGIFSVGKAVLGVDERSPEQIRRDRERQITDLNKECENLCLRIRDLIYTQEYKCQDTSTQALRTADASQQAAHLQNLKRMRDQLAYELAVVKAGGQNR